MSIWKQGTKLEYERESESEQAWTVVAFHLRNVLVTSVNTFIFLFALFNLRQPSAATVLNTSTGDFFRFFLQKVEDFFQHSMLISIV